MVPDAAEIPPLALPTTGTSFSKDSPGSLEENFFKVDTVKPAIPVTTTKSRSTLFPSTMAGTNLGNAGTPRGNDEEGLKTNPPGTEALAGDLDWERPDDPDNPRNWPLWQRILHSAIPALWSFGLYAAERRPDQSGYSC